MSRFEYKTTVLPYKFGLFKNDAPDVQTMLVRESDQGWQLKQMLMAVNNSGGADSILAVFERPR
jgi:hypothetical protein